MWLESNPMNNKHWGGLPYSERRAVGAVLRINNNERKIKPMHKNIAEIVVTGGAFVVIVALVVVLALK